MISPRTENVTLEGGSLGRFTEDFLQPGGALESACAKEPFPYEPRPQQEAMGRAVAEAIEQSRHLAVEAGTGVGKSFAYLVPLIANAVRGNTQAVVSTYTIALQEQLIRKDIPFLKEHMGLDFKAILVKGRSNYLCLRRLARARKMGPDLFKAGEQDELERIRVWADHTGDGTLQNMEHQPSPDVWSSVCAEQGNCLGRRCPEYSNCFLMRARADIRNAHLLVLNHHLFFAELSLRSQGAAFLPDYQTAVLDEAHMIEGVASEHLGIRLSHYTFNHWLRRLYTPDSGKGLLNLLREGKATHVVTQLWDAVEQLYLAIRKETGLAKDKKQCVLESPPSIETRVPNLLAELTTRLRDVIEGVENEDLQAELRSVRSRGCSLRDELEAFLGQTLHDQVYWVEQEGKRRKQTVLYSAPIEVAPILEESLFSVMDSIVMTSATLAVADSLDYFQNRVGATDCDALQLGSPFDFSRQMRIYVFKNMPNPNDTKLFPEAAANAIRQFVFKTRGRAFVLFTSSQLMKRVAEMLRDDIEGQGLTLLVQGEGIARHRMLERFRKEEACVLFGLDSFWMGVDVRGSALSNVIITKLPFSVPDQPLTKARMARIREKGGEPFFDYALPEAILKFRQGVGRLIRTAADDGIVVILDSRIVNQSYGKLFLRSIPECPVEMMEI